eukprot:154090_1
MMCDERTQDKSEDNDNDNDNDDENDVSTQTDNSNSIVSFVLGLSPFISALEEFKEFKTEEKTREEKKEEITEKELKNLSREEILMRPIRELIYKSFHEPSEGEEGILYVLEQLKNLNINNNSNSNSNNDLVIRSIGHFLSLTLPPSWIDSMCKWMLDRMQLILLKFFTFKHYCSCYFNCNINESYIFVLQCALHRRFPLLISEGCASLARTPVFYGTKQSLLFNDSRQNILRYSWQLLQTQTSFKLIPLYIDKKQQSNITTMDYRTLEQEIERDQSKGKLPCVVIATNNDNLQKIRSICDRHGLWLHIEGSNELLLAAATTLPKNTRIMMQSADSISCQPFEWFSNTNKKKKNIKYNKYNNKNKKKIKNKNIKKINKWDKPGCTT